MTQKKRLCSSYGEYSREEFLCSLHDQIEQTLLALKVKKSTKQGKSIIKAILCSMYDCVMPDIAIYTACLRADHNELINFLNNKPTKNEN